jgi:hypothetical protein
LADPKTLAWQARYNTYTTQKPQEKIIHALSSIRTRYPAVERPQTCALDGTVIRIGVLHSK